MRYERKSSVLLVVTHLRLHFIVAPNNKRSYNTAKPPQAEDTFLSFQPVYLTRYSLSLKIPYNEQDIFSQVEFYLTAFKSTAKFSFTWAVQISCFLFLIKLIASARVAQSDPHM